MHSLVTNNNTDDSNDTTTNNNNINQTTNLLTPIVNQQTRLIPSRTRNNNINNKTNQLNGSKPKCQQTAKQSTKKTICN